MSGRTWDVLFLAVTLTSAWGGGLGQQWPLPGSCGPCRCLLVEHSHGPRRYVNCSGLNLSALPKVLPHHMDVLDLSNNAISGRSLSDVCSNRNVQELNLSHNEIHSLQSGAFSGCNHLTSLDISGNRLTSIESQAFDMLINLQFLFGLETEVLGPNILRPFKRLKELKCVYYGSTLPPYVFGGTALQKLSLRLTAVEKLEPILKHENPSLLEISICGRNVRVINESLLSELVLVKQINLDFPSLPFLPRNIFYNAKREHGASNLQYLSVHGVLQLPPDILRELANLRNLTLSGINRLPQKQLFDGLSSLEHLNLSGSMIGRIPEGWFSELSGLSSLSLQETQLGFLLKEDFNRLHTLRKLDLSHNSITEVEPLTFAPMHNFLQTLNLEDNVLKKVDADIFIQLVFLQELNLGSNKLSIINDTAFKDLSQLHTLKLHDNKLVVLPLDLFISQINLRTLDLSSNAFLHLPRALLPLSGGLQVLNLDENLIGNIPKVLLTEFPNLKLLSLRNNPVLCNCQTEVMVESRPRLKIIGTCEGPPYFYGKSLTSLSTTYFCRTTTPVSHDPSMADLDVTHVSTMTMDFSSSVFHSSVESNDLPGEVHVVTPSLHSGSPMRTEMTTTSEQVTPELHGETHRSESFKPTATHFPKTATPGLKEAQEESYPRTSQPHSINATSTAVEDETGREGHSDSNRTERVSIDDGNEPATREGNSSSGSENVPFSSEDIQPNPTQPYDKYRIPDSSQDGSSRTTSGQGGHVIAPSMDVDVNITALSSSPTGGVRPLAMPELIMILASVGVVITVIIATYIAWFKRRQKKRNTYVIRRRTFSVTSV